MQTKTSIPHSENWLQTPSILFWSSGAWSGTVYAVNERALKMSKHFDDLESVTEEIELSWEDKNYNVSGTFKAAEGGSLFIVEKKDQNILTDLLHSLRKSHHLNLCRHQDVEASDRYTGFSEYSFVPEALPDLNTEDLNIESSFLNHKFGAPLLITGMTGGIEEGQEINRRLARAAARWNIPMGIGSQRMALENPKFRKIFTVKDESPSVFLIGNLGGAQLTKSNAVELCKEAVDMIQADALAIHLNVIQECLQVEGDAQFKGLMKNLEAIVREFSLPIIVKEVGSGISPKTAQRLFNIGIRTLDCGGRGGTSWGYIEGLRNSNKALADLGSTFRNWGIPTAFSLNAIRKEIEGLELIATGGIRDGLTVAKALALGAKMVGLGLPLMRAASKSEEELHSVLEVFIKGLKTTMIATGSQKPSELSKSLIWGLPCSPK